MSRMGSIGAIGLFLLGIIQFVAGYAGISDIFGTFWAILAMVVGVTLRLTLPLTIGAFFGAMNVWGWNWLASALLALPGLVFLIPGMITNIISALKGIKEFKNQPNNIAIDKSELNSSNEKLTQRFTNESAKIIKIFVKSFIAILTIFIIYNSYIVYSEWDKIIVDDEIFIKNTETKINTNGIDSLTKTEREKYVEISRIKNKYEEPMLNLLGVSKSEFEKKLNLDYAAGRTGIAWEVKKIVNKTLLYHKIQLSGKKYEHEVEFNCRDNFNELTKGIPSSEWSTFSLAKSNAHAKEIRELLLEKSKFLK